MTGAAERRLWTDFQGDQPIYTNLYVLLVAEPGIGKGNALGRLRSLWDECDDLHKAPTTLTRAALIDVLRLAEKTHKRSLLDSTIYTSLIVCAAEFGVFVPAYDLAFMNTLNDLYDCPRRFEELLRSRTREQQPPIINASLHMIAGTQPSYLASLLPEAAWSQGFPSRCIMVYCGQQPKVSLRTKNKTDTKLKHNLVHDLESIGQLYGEMQWTDEAMDAIEAWHLADYPPKPMHIRLQHYCARRFLHVVKLSMGFALARNNEIVVSLEDYQNALATLLEAEEAMPEIFKAMSSTDDARILDDLYFYCLRMQVKLKGPVPEQRLILYMSGQVPTFRVQGFLDIARASGRLQFDPGSRCYTAKARSEHE